MKTAVEYKTVYANSVGKFDEEVNEALQEGWQLRNSPIIFDDPIERHYCFAMPMTRRLENSK